ncbi:sugar transferase [Rhodovulum marinum]|uniref:Lipopolysaccharide/colanic/teichoic acid biosynthesis glycosyltransferase n=1 Tax=Rhodovulum marinum TaxID=320662 RepID=A0A4R2PTE6_9RHOB|nr:sugar transferase [Rhodovulum marinum]TCP39272.1 lipopolysaccharide/colanic/teichoic acid biosynthesis glycosyltransferase [Rhodovulum marinum]
MSFDGYSHLDLRYADVPRVQRPAPIARWSPRYRVFKFAFDKGMSIAAMPIILGVAVVLLLLNPFLNPGPLFFRQERMGLGGQKFLMWKFRTMLPSNTVVRHHNEPLEEDRITPLGRFLRKTRLDELPNFFNVLRGEMSVIGPRPDAWSHARSYVGTVPHYQLRFRVRPGITGLAQIHAGYADCDHAIRRKARFDRLYVSRSRIKMELHIIWHTVRVMLTGWGAK